MDTYVWEFVFISFRCKAALLPSLATCAFLPNMDFLEESFFPVFDA